jgi:hypothetical protein
VNARRSGTGRATSTNLTNASLSASSKHLNLTVDKTSKNPVQFFSRFDGGCLLGEARDGSAAATTSSTGAAAPVTTSTSGPDPLVGRVINDRYKITALIARGGMGKVYSGEQAPLGRQVALKFLHPNYKGEHDPDFHRRFFLEAATCAKLTHPNTVTIFDYGRGVAPTDARSTARSAMTARCHRSARSTSPVRSAAPFVRRTPST